MVKQFQNPEAAYLLGKLGYITEFEGLVAGNVNIED